MREADDLLDHVQGVYPLGIRFHVVGGVAANLAKLSAIGCMPNRGKVDVGQI